MMKYHLFRISFLVLAQDSLGLVDDDDACQRIKLAITHLGLLSNNFASVDLKGHFDAPPCKLAWEINQTIPKHYGNDPGEHYSEGPMNRDPTLSSKAIRGRTLLVPEKVFGAWGQIPFLLHLNNHVLRLSAEESLFIVIVPPCLK